MGRTQQHSEEEKKPGNRGKERRLYSCPADRNGLLHRQPPPKALFSDQVFPWDFLCYCFLKVADLPALPSLAQLEQPPQEMGSNRAGGAAT